MKPVFLEFHLPVIGEVTFPAYMTMLMIGFIVSISLARRQGERLGMNGNHIVDLGLLMLVLGVLGARILSVLADGKFMDFVHLCTDPRQVEAIDRLVDVCQTDAQCGFHYLCDTETQTCHPPRDCLAALKFWWGGLTYYGGVLLAVPGGMWYARRKGMGVWRVADLTAPFVMLGLFFGRLGCFFNGCCFGADYHGFASVSLPGHAHPVHPTQLYESLGALVLFFVLYAFLRPRKRGHGEIFGWLLVLYGVLRTFLEVFRADARGSIGPLSTSQLISIPLIVIGVYLIVRIRRQADAEAAPETDSEGEFEHESQGIRQSERESQDESQDAAGDESSAHVDTEKRDQTDG